MPNENETLAVVLALVVALGCVLLAVIIVAVVPTTRDGGPGAGPGSACAEWTDGCVVCLRTPQGPACSTPGIACVQGPMRCLRE